LKKGKDSTSKELDDILNRNIKAAKEQIEIDKDFAHTDYDEEDKEYFYSIATRRAVNSFCASLKEYEKKGYIRNSQLVNNL